MPDAADLVSRLRNNPNTLRLAGVGLLVVLGLAVLIWNVARFTTPTSIILTPEQEAAVRVDQADRDALTQLSPADLRTEVRTREQALSAIPASDEAARLAAMESLARARDEVERRQEAPDPDAPNAVDLLGPSGKK